MALANRLTTTSCCWILSLAPATTSAQSQLEIAAESGEAAPGLPGETFSFFDAPTVNGSGQLAFTADTNEVTRTNALWVWDGQALRFVAAGGEVQPGSIEPLRSVSRFRFNNAGRVLFEGEDDSPQRGVWAETEAELIAVALEDEPGPAGANWNLFPREVAWSDDLLAYEASIGSPPVRGIWAGEPANPGVIALEDDPSPFGGQVYTIAFGKPWLNARGALAFRFETTLSGGLQAGPPDDLQVFVELGEAAPGGGFFSSLSISEFTERDEICFRSGLKDEQGQFLEQGGLYLATRGEIDSLFRGGSGAPGIEGSPPLTFGFDDPACANGGQFVFQGELISEESFPPEGIWSGNQDRVDLVAFQGSQAPGLPDGVTFRRLPAGLTPLLVNSAGVVAFIAVVEGDGVNFNNDEGLWAGSPGSIRLVARLGDDFEVRPGEFRRLRRIELAPHALTEDHRIAVALEFIGLNVVGFLDVPRAGVDPMFGADFELIQGP